MAPDTIANETTPSTATPESTDTPVAPVAQLCPACTKNHFSSLTALICGPCQALIRAVANGATHLLRDPLVNELYKAATAIAGVPTVDVAKSVVEEAVPGLADAVKWFTAFREEAEALVAELRTVLADAKQAVVPPVSTSDGGSATTGGVGNNADAANAGNVGAIPPTAEELANTPVVHTPDPNTDPTIAPLP